MLRESRPWVSVTSHPVHVQHLWPLGADADRAAAALVAGLALPGEKTQQ
jgi:hypothetical protein